MINAIDDNPVQGNEQNFLQIKDHSDGTSSYSDNAILQPDHTYDGYIYIHNDASGDLPDSTASETTVSIRLPPSLLGTESMSAYVFAKHAFAAVNDAISAPDSVPLQLVLASDSIVLHTLGKANGLHLDAGEFTSDEGAKIGCDSLNGELPPGARCSAYVTFEFSTRHPPFSIVTTASGSDNESVVAAPGDVVTLYTEYVNTGLASQRNGSIDVTVSSGLELVQSGPTGMFDSTSRGVPSFGVSVTPYELIARPSHLFAYPTVVKQYPSGDGATLYYSVKVSADGPFECGNRWLVVDVTLEVGTDKIPDQFIIDVDAIC